MPDSSQNTAKPHCHFCCRRGSLYIHAAAVAFGDRDGDGNNHRSKEKVTSKMLKSSHIYLFFVFMCGNSTVFSFLQFVDLILLNPEQSGLNARYFEKRKQHRFYLLAQAPISSRHMCRIWRQAT
jgi:hypothetical protein